MSLTVKTAIKATARRLGFEITRLNRPASRHPFEDDPAYAEIISAVRPYTMTSCERLAAVIDGARHISRLGIPGAVVECGVWRGGSTMAAALALQQQGDIRDLYLFDTFGGMTEPTAADVDFRGSDARGRFAADEEGTDKNWCYASLQDVQANLARVGYPSDRIHYVQGDVLKTLPAQAPGRIALLRLDTDWYESTKHEMESLYPALASGGVLIVDDYGHWNGCRQAVDEYFARGGPMLCRIDYTGRIAIKP